LAQVAAGGGAKPEGRRSFRVRDDAGVEGLRSTQRRYRGFIRHFRWQVVFASTQGAETARRGAVPLTRRLSGRSSGSTLGFQRQKFLGAGGWLTPVLSKFAQARVNRYQS